MWAMLHTTQDQMNNCRWDNTCAFGDQVDHCNPQKMSLGKVQPRGEHFTQYGCNDHRAKSEPPSYQQYKPGNFLAVVPQNWSERIDEDDDADKWRDPGLLRDGRSLPGDGNDNDDSEGEEDTQGCENVPWKGKGIQDGKGKGNEMEDGKGKGMGKGKANKEGKGKGKRKGKGKGLVKLSPVGDDISCAIAFQSGRKCMRQTRTRRANESRFILYPKHRPPGEFPQMMISTRPRSRTANTTQNKMLMWICAWRMMWTQCAAFNWTAMWISKGTVTMKSRMMKRRKMSRRRKTMRRRMRRRMIAKNLGRLARVWW